MRTLIFATLTASCLATSAAAQTAVDSTRTPFFKRIGKSVSRFVRNFSDVDTNYIEPQKYNYTVMLQNTNTYELYRISSAKGNDFTFAPLPSMKLARMWDGDGCSSATRST